MKKTTYFFYIAQCRGHRLQGIFKWKHSEDDLQADSAYNYMTSQLSEKLIETNVVKTLGQDLEIITFNRL